MSNIAGLCSFNFSFPQSSLAFNTRLDLVGQMWSSLANTFLPIVQRKFSLMLTQLFKFYRRMLCTAFCFGINDSFSFCFVLFQGKQFSAVLLCSQESSYCLDFFKPWLWTSKCLITNASLSLLSYSRLPFVLVLVSPCMLWHIRIWQSDTTCSEINLILLEKMFFFSKVT